MKKLPLIWPSGRRNLFIGNTRAVLYPNALQTFGIKRVLLVDNITEEDQAVRICRAAKMEYARLATINGRLPHSEEGRFVNIVLPWMCNAQKYHSPLLIASPDGVNRAPAVAMACIALIVFNGVDFGAAIGIAVEIVTHACDFAAPTPKLFGSLLQSMGWQLPETYRQIYKDDLTKS